MSANSAHYLLSIGEIDSKNFEVIGFTGVDALSAPYYFDIDFRMSASSKSTPLDAGVLGKPCRLDIKRTGDTIPYCGIVTEFRVIDSADSRYTVRLSPRIYHLTLNIESRVFQNLTVPDIVKSVVDGAGLGEYFRFDLKADDVKYPVRNFCVQYHESGLAFISRLMEESGIWYYFDQVKEPGGALKECAVVTDDFSKYPILGRAIPFMRGSGLAEISGSGKGSIAESLKSGVKTGNIADVIKPGVKSDDVIESVNYLSARAALMPKSVRVRAYNHRVPEAAPDGVSDVKGGHLGQVYEYGGTLRNSGEAEFRAGLYARRLWVESSGVDGKGSCASFRAGLLAPIRHDANKGLSGSYLLISVTHRGGWEKGAYTYGNEFSCVRAEDKIYAPSLRTTVPRIEGVTTAPIGATGGSIPTLNEYGNYNVNMPFVPNDGQGGSGQNAGDYGGSKHIRLAQPSGGMSDDKPYGIHFPSKRGAEMVLAYVDGNPDRPLGLGFVPNGASPSVTRNTNSVENVMRSWGGSELVMNDTDGDKSVKLSTPGERYLELRDGDELVRVKSADSELLFNDAEKQAEINVGGHVIGIIYKDGEGKISIATASGNVIEMNDPENIITVKNAGEENKVVLNGKDNMISIDSSDNTVVVNGKEKRITLDSVDNTVVVNGKEKKVTVESANSKGVFDGKGDKIIMENKDNKVIIDGGDNSVTLEAKKDVNIKAGGKLVIDAKGGISNKGQAYDIN